MRPDHRRLALEVAEKSIVLLKNRDSLLPLTGQERVGVIGRLANVANTGDAGSSNTHPVYVVTPLEGLQDTAPAAGLTYDDGTDAARVAQVAGQADLALVVVGYSHLDEGEFIAPDADPEILKLFPAPVSAEEATIAAQMQQAVAGAAAREGSFSMGQRPEAADAARRRRSSDSSGDGGQSAHRGGGDGERSLRLAPVSGSRATGRTPQMHGSRPPGLVCPSRTFASARPPSMPEYHSMRIAAAASRQVSIITALPGVSVRVRA